MLYADQLAFPEMDILPGTYSHGASHYLICFETNCDETDGIVIVYYLFAAQEVLTYFELRAV
jgi:hypothetical protein